MRRAFKALLVIAVSAIVCMPMQARADGFFTPWAGVAFGNNPNTGRGAFGASGGYMGGGIIGGEVDLGVSPSFFGTKTDFGSNSVITLMGNVIAGVPIGGTLGPGVRPYAVGGVGLFRSQYDGGNLFRTQASNNDFGWNLGAGVMGFFSDHVGLRGDVRYFRDTDDHGVPPSLHFWRASVGVAFR